jgi:hypothetical protein
VKAVSFKLFFHVGGTEAGVYVVPGVYKARVELAGYTTALSPAVTIPPAVFDLNIALVPVGGCADVNDAPVADDDNYSTLEDVNLVASAPGVLDGDTDPDLDSLTAELVLGSGPANGTLSLNSDGSFTYIPNANFSGVDSFRYRAFDGELYSAEATVSIVVTALDEDPVCSSVSINTIEDTVVTRNLAPDCFDPDGGTIVEVEIVALSLKGNVTVVSAPSTTVQYAPFPNENGSDSFQFRAKNSAGRWSNTATANIAIAPVNDPPDARDDTASTVEDSDFIDIDVLSNDTDPDIGKPSDSLTVVAVFDVQHGTVVLVGGLVKYKPDPNHDGPDSFRYTIQDEAGVQDTATVSINVAGVNDPPTIDTHGNESAEATGPSGAPVSFVSPAAGDVEDGDLSSQVVCSPSSGSTFPLGVTTVECSVTDSGGLSASSFFDVFIVDTTPPTIDGKAPVIAEATGPDGAVVTYAPPTARDLVSGNFDAICDPASGSLFPLGLTVVRCFARDAAGNTSLDSFLDVFVVDTTPPAIEPHDDIYIVTADPGGVVVDYTPSATDDAVSGDGVADCNPPSGSTFPSGNRTRVRFVATDGAGNSAESFFDVFIELDLSTNNPPVVTPQSNVTVEALRVALYTIGTFTDDDGDTHTASVDWGDGRSQSVGVNEATGDINDARHVYLAPGTYHVEVEVCDQEGECASAFFDVFVRISEPFIKVDFREITFFKNKDVIGSSDADIRPAWGLPAFNPDDPAQWPYYPGGGHDKTKSRPTKFRIYGFSSSAAGTWVSNADGTAFYEVVSDPDIAGAYYVDIGGPGMVLIAVSDLQLSQLQRGGGDVDRDAYPGTTRLTDAQRNVSGIHLARNRDKISVPKRVREEQVRLGAPLVNERGRKTSKAYVDYVGFQLWGHGASKYKEFVDVEISFVHDAVDHYRYGFHTAKNVNFEGIKGCEYLDSRPGNDTSRFNDVWEGKHPTWGKACGSKENRHNQQIRANYDVPLNAIQLLASVNTGDDTVKVFFGMIRGTIAGHGGGHDDDD